MIYLTLWTCTAIFDLKVFKISASSKISDLVDKHVISLEGEFKSHESELDDTGSSKELRYVPNSPLSFLDSIRIYDVEPKINLDAVLGNGSGILPSRDMGLALYGQMERNRENHNNFPIRSNMFLPAQETVETGYTLKETPKKPLTNSGFNEHQTIGRGEDPKTYVPLAVRERKQDDYYWHHF